MKIFKRGNNLYTKAEECVEAALMAQTGYKYVYQRLQVTLIFGRPYAREREFFFSNKQLMCIESNPMVKA